MNTPLRYSSSACHYIISFSNESYGNATSFSHLKEQFAGTPAASVPDEYYISKNTTISSPLGRKANAAIVMLARNGDLDGTITSVKQMEDRFNKKFNYPYVFLNEEPFSDEFKTRVAALTDATVQFGLIPHEHWYQPDWIDETRASAARAAMVKNNVIYVSPPYRNMCRFTFEYQVQFWFFFKHDLLKPYRYYWRVEPHVTFFCDLDYDPFLYMQDNDKVYSFVLSLPEYPATIPTLWDTVKEFVAGNPTLLPADNARGFLSDDGGETYNRCHFWSNFEIGDMELWRGEAYSKFFDALDRKGGFYYERWGDAPVHSIGAALFARKDQIHFFNEVGYRHEPFQHCPQGAAHDKGKCWCNQKDNFGTKHLVYPFFFGLSFVNLDYDRYSCLKKYDALFKS
ncbi:glycosyltransferase family 15 protein [Mycena filopes]|nr:glycosyltransferase family 15 protein [Mycena filopes]